MAKTVTLKDKDTGEQVYPMTLAQNVVTSEGRTIGDDYVDRVSAQEVSGVKAFKNGVSIGKAGLSYDSDKNALVITFND